MKVFRLDDLSYLGRHEKTLEWDHPAGSQPYYWHPDWLQNAEDLMGVYPSEQDPSASHPDKTSR